MDFVLLFPFTFVLKIKISRFRRVQYYTRKFTEPTRTLTNYRGLAGGRLCSVHQARPIGKVKKVYGDI